MWIRSQGRKGLGDYKELLIVGNQIVGYSNMGDYSTYLGSYETEEKAKEVLDMIQGRIIAGAQFDTVMGNKRTTKDFVFQMPAK